MCADDGPDGLPRRGGGGAVMVATRTEQPGGQRARERCDHCGRQVRRSRVESTVRLASLVFCDAGCHDDHVVLVALSAARCTVAGCDLDAVGDALRCDEHLDPLAA
jgi:hypothetical protein